MDHDGGSRRRVTAHLCFFLGVLRGSWELSMDKSLEACPRESGRSVGATPLLLAAVPRLWSVCEKRCCCPAPHLLPEIIASARTPVSAHGAALDLKDTVGD